MPVTLHVGFSKTATTSLQDELFPYLPGIENMGKPFRNADGSVKPLYRLLREVNFCDCLHYDAESTQAAVRAIIGKSPFDRILISAEGLTYSRHNDQVLVAQRLRNVFGSARVIFTIREQVSWMQSLYLDDCGRETMTAPMPTFRQWYRQEMNKRNRSACDMINFHALIAIYCNLFGRENVFVLPFELMINDPDAFSEGISSILGVEDRNQISERIRNLPRNNGRLSMRRFRFGIANYYFVPAYFRRFLASLPKPVLRYLDAGPSAKFAVPADLIRAIQARVAPGNQALSQEFNLDLARFGYAM